MGSPCVLQAIQEFHTYSRLASKSCPSTSASQVLGRQACTTPLRLLVTICDCSVPPKVNPFLIATEEKEWNFSDPGNDFWVFRSKCQNYSNNSGSLPPQLNAEVLFILPSDDLWLSLEQRDHSWLPLTAPSVIPRATEKGPYPEHHLGGSWLSHCFERNDSLWVKFGFRKIPRYKRLNEHTSPISQTVGDSSSGACNPQNEELSPRPRCC